ncbi:MAG: RagB/SusD family nutrient uptake outer membrane protein, partial [Chitinophagaceae bacterium]|nr:RagB/SusD family nutrient uptake outer membrane protein [Chitinophagaceae bacterium]
MKKYIILLLSIASLSSCKKYLEEEMISNVSYEFYDSEQGIESLVLAAYAPLRSLVNEQNGINLANLGTDIYTTTRVAQGNDFHLYTSDINSTNGTFAFIWNNFYKGINSCNIAINRIPKVEGLNQLRTEEGKNRRKGEVHFLRAFYYFRLVQTFGRIPLLVEENLTVLNDLKRSEVPQLYEAIISDLKFASENLPATQTEYARATRAAAQHLLAKVYLTRGSAVTEQRGQKATDMDSAAYYAEQVIAARGALLPDYNTARNPQNEKNSDILFAIQFTSNVLANDVGNFAHLFYVSQYDNIPGGGMDRDLANGRAFVRLMPTNYLWDLYDRKNDSRIYKAYKTVWICNTNDVSKIQKWTAASAPNPALVGQPKYRRGDTAIVFTFNTEASQTVIDRKPYVWFPRNKWTDRFFPHYRYHLDPTRAGLNNTDGYLDFPLFWLAETYLIAAEAYGRKADYTKAVEYINVVRKRAAYKQGEVKPFHFVTADGGNPADITTATEAAMEIGVAAVNSPDKIRDFILEERARELGGDHERWYDLVRTETFYDRVRQYNTAAAANIRQFHKLRPIPQTHIDRLANP